MNEDQINIFQELIAGIYIQQLRIYDLLAVMVSKDMPEKMSELEKLHSEGKILCPDPSLTLESNNEN